MHLLMSLVRKQKESPCYPWADKIWLEQCFYTNTDIQVSLIKILKTLHKAAKKNNWNLPTCFISYAWPHENYPEEGWIQTFLENLSQHLSFAGISIFMDRRNNRIGGSVYGFINHIEGSDYVIVAGSKSLLLKHKIGKSHICGELNKIREKATTHILPILLSGQLKNSFPEWFEGYTNIIDWREEGYIINLKELLRGLYNLELDNQTFNKIWQTFETQHSALTKDLYEKLVVQFKNNELGWANNKFKKSDDYSIKFLMDSIQNTIKTYDLQLNSLNQNNEHLKKNNQKFKFSLIKIILFFIFFSSLSINQLFFKNDFFQSVNSIIKKISLGTNKSLGHSFTDNKNIMPTIMNPILTENVHQLFSKTYLTNSSLTYIAITGFWGTGKTIFAKNYSDLFINKIKGNNKLRWFIRSNCKSTREEDYRNLAKELNIAFNFETPLSELVDKVNRELANFESFILIFDDVEKFQDIAQFIPNDQDIKGYILITSRRADILPVTTHLNVFTISLNNGFSEPEFTSLFNKLTNNIDYPCAHKLFKRLGGSPLALVQSAEYINCEKLNCSGYLNLYEQQHKELLATAKENNTYHSKILDDGAFETKLILDTTLKFTLNKLSPEAQDILFIIAYLNSDSIPLTIFDSLNLPPDKLKSSLKELERHSLINFDLNKKYFSTHRLIQDMTRAIIKGKYLIMNEEEHCLNKVLKLIHSAHGLNINTEHDYYTKQYLIPHLEFALSMRDYSKNPAPAIVQGMVDLALLYKSIGKAKLSSEYYEKILPYLSQQPDDLKAEVYKGLGRAYQGSGRFESAKDAYEKSYEIYLKSQKENTSEMAAVLNDLAMILHDIGITSSKERAIYYQKSLLYLKQALQITKNFQNQQKNTIRYLTNLGELYRSLENFDEAEKTLHDAIQIGHQEYPNQKHRLMASAYFNLGNIYMDKGMYHEAKLYFEKAVEISSHENVAGKNHPLSARFIDALGMAWRKLGIEQNACAKFEEANTILQSSQLGQKQLKETISKHLETCSSLNTDLNKS